MNTRKQKNYQELIANIYMQIKGLVYICEGWCIQKESCHSIPLLTLLCLCIAGFSGGV